MLLPWNQHGTYDWDPASVEDLPGELVSHGDDHPQRNQNQEQHNQEGGHPVVGHCEKWNNQLNKFVTISLE